MTDEEEEWLTKYLDSLEEVDKKSDMFRFPFEDEFLSKYRDKFLNNVDIANNLLQCFSLVKKCIEKGIVLKEDEFDSKLKPEFFVLRHMELVIVICGKGSQTKDFMLRLQGILR